MSGFVRKLAFAGCALGMAACSDGGTAVTVSLEKSVVQLLNPADPAVRLQKVRVSVRGTQTGEDSTRDLGPSDDVASFEAIPGDGPVSVRVEGFDELGNIVAFGRKSGVELDGDTNISVPFRRNLAYITHSPNERQRQPAAFVYLVDVATHAYLQKVRLPGANPIGRGISARGGDAMLITYQDNGAGFVGVLSAATNEVSSIALPRPQDLALAASGSAIGVVAGGGLITFVDFDAGTVVEEFAQPVGGRVLDGAISESGRGAIFILDVEPGAVLVDLERREVTSLNVAGTPGGVAPAQGGRLAYVTSRETPEVVGVDLETGRIEAFTQGFARPVAEAAFSEEMPGVLALFVQPGNGAARVLGWVPTGDGAGLSFDDGTPTLRFPTGIAADGSGRRLVVVAAGTSTASAGLTVLDTFAGFTPEGASSLYPTDPDDTYSDGSFLARQRYQPRAVGIIYGR